MGKILVIEDHAGWQHIITEVLQEENYNALCASTLDEAKETLNKFPIDLAILDINLTDVPGNRDGEEFINCLKGIPYIIVSGTLPSEEYTFMRRAFAFFSKHEFESRRDKFKEAVTGALRLRTNSFPVPVQKKRSATS